MSKPSDSPLGQAQSEHGVTTTQDLQRKQAEARTLSAHEAPVANSTATPMSVEDIKEMKAMAAEYGQELVDLHGQRTALETKIAETSALIVDINSRIAQAEYKPLHVLNREYLEQQKTDLEARFMQSRRIKEALASVGVEGNFDYTALGNGPSPLDQAIAAKNQGRRQVVRVGK